MSGELRPGGKYEEKVEKDCKGEESIRTATGKIALEGGKDLQVPTPSWTGESKIRWVRREGSWGKMTGGLGAMADRTRSIGKKYHLGKERGGSPRRKVNNENLKSQGGRGIFSKRMKGRLKMAKVLGSRGFRTSGITTSWTQFSDWGTDTPQGGGKNSWEGSRRATVRSFSGGAKKVYKSTTWGLNRKKEGQEETAFGTKKTTKDREARRVLS